MHFADVTEKQNMSQNSRVTICLGTYGGLNIFRIAHHVKQVSSSECVGEGIFKRAEVVVDFAEDESSELSLREAFVFM